MLSAAAVNTTVNTGATLALNDFSTQVEFLAGSGSVTLGSKAATVLTLGVPVGSMTHQNVPYQIWDLKGRIIAVEKLQIQDHCNAQSQVAAQ